MIKERDITRAHDEIHEQLDHIEEVAEMLNEAALDDGPALSQSRLFFLARAARGAAEIARAAAKRLPGNPYI